MKTTADKNAEQAASLRNAFHLLQTAYTRAEIEAAKAAAAAHMARYPEDRGRDIGHGFHYREEYLEAREAESKRLGLTPEEHEAREAHLFFAQETRRSVNQAEDQDALKKYRAAKNRLQNWLRRHPDDREALSLIKSLDEDIDLTKVIQAAMTEDGITKEKRIPQLA